MSAFEVEKGEATNKKNKKDKIIDKWNVYIFLKKKYKRLCNFSNFIDKKRRHFQSEK